jgi:hypothetical protein
LPACAAARAASLFQYCNNLIALQQTRKAGWQDLHLINEEFPGAHLCQEQSRSLRPSYH